MKFQVNTTFILYTTLRLFLTSCNQKQEKILPSKSILTESVYSSVTIQPDSLYQLYAVVAAILENNLVEEGDLVHKRIPFYKSLIALQNSARKMLGLLYNWPEKIIMGDEPMGNLDSYNSENVFRIFKKLKEEGGLSLLVVTHDNDFANRTDRIIQMENGRVIA